MQTKSQKPTTAKKEKTAHRDPQKILAGIGEKVKFRDFEAEVKELCLEDLLRFSDEMVRLIGIFSEIKVDNEDDGYAWFLTAIKKPEIISAVKSVAAASTGKTPHDFDKLPLSDWLKWAAAFKTVTNWEELQAAFFALIPSQLGDRLKERGLKGLTETA